MFLPRPPDGNQERLLEFGLRSATSAHLDVPADRLDKAQAIARAVDPGEGGVAVGRAGDVVHGGGCPTEKPDRTIPDPESIAIVPVN